MLRALEWVHDILKKEVVPAVTEPEFPDVEIVRLLAKAS